VVEEHLQAKRLLATLVDGEPDRDAAELRDLARQMTELEAQRRKDEPSATIPDETEEPAPI
jgi:hypothetical protein